MNWRWLVLWGRRPVFQKWLLFLWFYSIVTTAETEVEPRTLPIPTSCPSPTDSLYSHIYMESPVSVTCTVFQLRQARHCALCWQKYLLNVNNHWMLTCCIVCCCCYCVWCGGTGRWITVDRILPILRSYKEVFHIVKVSCCRPPLRSVVAHKIVHIRLLQIQK